MMSSAPPVAGGTRPAIWPWLLAALLAVPGSRVVTVSSMSHGLGRIPKGRR